MSLRLQSPEPDRRAGRRSRTASAAISIGAHVGLLMAILTAAAEVPPPMVEPRFMTVRLVAERPPADPVPAPPTPEPAPAKAPQAKSPLKPTPAPKAVDPMPAGEDTTMAQGIEVSDSELAGAATAGSGPAGGGCNMPRLLQNALRRDHLVQAAVAQTHDGKPILVWNGAWVRRAGQDGNGLAAVREAMMWEIGFAPAACRSEPIKGLVLLSLNDRPDSPRLVIGAGAWRWTDLLS